MKNPIINNRIVSGITFALRLKAFIEEVQVCDAMSEEEQEYLLNIADRLLRYQADTAMDKGEVDYLKRCGVNIK